MNPVAVNSGQVVQHNIELEPIINTRLPWEDIFFCLLLGIVAAYFWNRHHR
jgi:hypothetical protein